MIISIDKKFTSFSNSKIYTRKEKFLPKGLKIIREDSILYVEDYWILNYFFNIQDQSDDFVLNISDSGLEIKSGETSYDCYSTFGVNVSKFDNILRLDYKKNMEYQAFRIANEYVYRIKNFTVDKTQFKDRIELYEKFYNKKRVEFLFSNEEDFAMIYSQQIKLLRTCDLFK